MRCRSACPSSICSLKRVFLFLGCHVNGLELYSPSQSADPPPVHLPLAPAVLLDRPPPLPSCVCSTRFCVVVPRVLCGRSARAAHRYFNISLEMSVFVDLSSSVVLLLCCAWLHHPSGWPASCHSTLAVLCDAVSWVVEVVCSIFAARSLCMRPSSV